MMQKKIWLVSREYAGVAEAGGVKNVTASLAEGMVQLEEIECTSEYSAELTAEKAL